MRAWPSSAAGVRLDCLTGQQSFAYDVLLDRAPVDTATPAMVGDLAGAARLRACTDGRCRDRAMIAIPMGRRRRSPGCECMNAIGTHHGGDGSW